MLFPLTFLEIGPFSHPLAFGGVWFACWMFTFFSSVNYQITYEDEMYSSMTYAKKGIKIKRAGLTPKAVGVAALWALALAIYVADLHNRCLN